MLAGSILGVAYYSQSEQLHLHPDVVARVFSLATMAGGAAEAEAIRCNSHASARI